MYYVIDRATGQITVGATADEPRGQRELNRSGVSFRKLVPVHSHGHGCVTDPYGPPDGSADHFCNSVEVTVTITINDVNEAPIVSGGLTNTSLAENFDSNG